MTKTKQFIIAAPLANQAKSLCIASLIALAGISLSPSIYAQTPPPPELGEVTKGTPAIPEGEPIQPQDSTSRQTATQTETPFGQATVTEHKRENGQVYLIELEHSLGGKQFLYENDSDGQIGSSVDSGNGLSEIPKWKLGSW